MLNFVFGFVGMWLFFGFDFFDYEEFSGCVAFD